MENGLIKLNRNDIVEQIVLADLVQSYETLVSLNNDGVEGDDDEAIKAALLLLIKYYCSPGQFETLGIKECNCSCHD